MRLITHLQNIRYLTGFTGSSAFMLLARSKAYLFTDFRYREIAQKLEASGKSRIPFQFIESNADLEKALTKILKTTKKIEFEADHMTVSQLKRWEARLKCMEFTPLKKQIEDQRLYKDKEEIRLLKKSQKINELTLERIKKLCKKGVTEAEIGWKIKTIGHDLGAEDISFEPIVAFGPHSAIPHHHPTNKKLKAKDIILIDMGMKFKGYCSDMTRTFFKGKPSSTQQVIYQKVLDAQLAAIKTIKAGVTCKKVDEIARSVMGTDAQYFGHSLGHGIGLDVHESPSLSTRSKETLKEGMIVTVEPGIYLEGNFGVRIEDMGLVTKTGYQNFTTFSK